jgi:hypothetical protein
VYNGLKWPRIRSHDDDKMDVKRIHMEYVNWIQLAQDRIEWR